MWNTIVAGEAGKVVGQVGGAEPDNQLRGVMLGSFREFGKAVEEAPDTVEFLVLESGYFGQFEFSPQLISSVVCARRCRIV